MTTDTSPDIEDPVETALDALETRDAVAAGSTMNPTTSVVGGCQLPFAPPDRTTSGVEGITDDTHDT